MSDTEQAVRWREATPHERMNAATDRARGIIRRLKEIEGEQAALKAELESLRRREIPELMAELQTTVWNYDGTPVKLGTVVRGSLKQAPDEEAAVEELRRCGFAGALKTVLSLEFGEDERDKCADMAAMLEQTLDRDATLARSVHASTLAAWARERLSEGKDVALDKLGLAMWREATITVRD